MPVGAAVRVKVLGALALIDQNETDWKVRRRRSCGGGASRRPLLCAAV
jgi:inorganic pyrophosphatase